MHDFIHESCFYGYNFVRNRLHIKRNILTHIELDYSENRQYII